MSWRWFVECKRGGVRVPTAPYEAVLSSGGSSPVQPPLSEPFKGSAKAVVVTPLSVSRHSVRARTTRGSVGEDEDEDDLNGVGGARRQRPKRRLCWVCGGC